MYLIFLYFELMPFWIYLTNIAHVHASLKITSKITNTKITPKSLSYGHTQKNNVLFYGSYNMLITSPYKFLLKDMSEVYLISLSCLQYLISYNRVYLLQINNKHHRINNCQFLLFYILLYNFNSKPHFFYNSGRYHVR